jgi:hypothetical protein
MIQQPLELEDASKNARLNLDTDEKKVDTFPECLRDPIGEAYDMSIATIKVEEEDEIEVFTWFNGVFNHQTCQLMSPLKPDSTLNSLWTTVVSANLSEWRVERGGEVTVIFFSDRRLTHLKHRYASPPFRFLKNDTAYELPLTHARAACRLFSLRRVA